MADEERSDRIAQLLQRAGRRAGPPAEVEQRMHQHVRRAWQGAVARRRRVRWLSAAAAVFAVLGGSWLFFAQGGHVPAVVVAQLDHGQPALMVERGGRRVELGAAGIPLLEGDRLTVGNGDGVVLKPAAASDVSIRLAANSALEWTRPQEVRLLSGSLYIAAQSRLRSGQAGHVELTVLAGSVRIEHVGTQYKTTLRDQEIEVAVRDGLVQIESNRQRELLTGGEVARIAPDGALRRMVVSPKRDEWMWADALMEPFAIEGRSLYEVLAEIGVEGGMQIEYDSPRVATAVRQTILHGPPLKLQPANALNAVLATTEFATLVSDATATAAPKRVRIAYRH